MIVEAVLLAKRSVIAEVHHHAPAEVSLPQLRILAYLQDHAGISLCALAEQLGFLPSSASKVVEQLVTRGLITRQDDPADRRRAVLALTSAGETTLCTARQAILPYLIERLAALSADEQMTLAEGMRLLHKLFAPERDLQTDPAAEIEMK